MSDGHCVIQYVLELLVAVADSHTVVYTPHDNECRILLAWRFSGILCTVVADHLAPAFGKEAMRSRPPMPKGPKSTPASTPKSQPPQRKAAPAAVKATTAGPTPEQPVSEGTRDVAAESKKRDRPAETSDRCLQSPRLPMIQHDAQCVF